MHVPRVSLLRQVADQLCAKYSKEYGKLCRTNQIGTVNDRVRNWWNSCSQLELAEQTCLAVAFCPFFLWPVADACGSLQSGVGQLCCWGPACVGAREHSAEVAGRRGPAVLAVDGEEQSAWSPGLCLPAASSAAVPYWEQGPPQGCTVLPAAGGPGWDRAPLRCPGPPECLCTLVFQLMHKLSVEAPPKILVERYLIEIAKNYNVPYEPDSVVMVSEAPASLELPSVLPWLKCPVSAVRAFRAQGCGIAANSVVIVL